MAERNRRAGVARTGSWKDIYNLMLLAQNKRPTMPPFDLADAEQSFAEQLPEDNPPMDFDLELLKEQNQGFAGDPSELGREPRLPAAPYPITEDMRAGLELNMPFQSDAAAMNEFKAKDAARGKALLDEELRMLMESIKRRR